MRPFEDHPLTEDERLREIAKIFAAGLLPRSLQPTLVAAAAHVPACENPGNLPAHGLESGPAPALIHHAD